VRGIADSSFNGTTQSTVGQYLGDARLNYNAPDPDLALYDMATVEVLEGPQGTLYGAGTLGGIIRLVPVMPDLDRFTAGLSLGVSGTLHGAPSGDQAALINVPIVTGTVGLRLLGYRVIDGGYIDDPGRGLSDINRTRTEGGRLELRIRPGDDWTIDITGVIQNINSRDGQYADRGLPPLQRSSVLSQPFDNDYALGNIVLRHPFGSLDFTSSTTIVRHDVTTDFDASPSAAAPRLYREDDRITLLTNETRLSHQGANGGGWVTGVELLHSTDRIQRELGTPAALLPISGNRNTAGEAAVFGEVTVPLLRTLFLTGGGRIGFDAATGEVLDDGNHRPGRRRRALVFLPSAGLLWKISPRLSAYARYQEGYRAGGLSVSGDTVKRFRGDSLATIETGLRFGDGSRRFDATAAVSFAHWESIQADLVDANGLPITANIGDGRVLGLEVRANWRPVVGLALSGGVFVNDSSLYRPAPAFVGEHDASLPNVADMSGQARISYDRSIGHAGSIGFTAAARYVGGSKLGVGPILALPQGHYLDTSAGLRWTTLRGISFSLDMSNLLDDGRNQFALGDPFSVTAAQQVTPLRPRTIRFGVSAGF
jgi:outer membrane receptor protein involved in Fe transport